MIVLSLVLSLAVTGAIPTQSAPTSPTTACAVVLDLGTADASLLAPSEQTPTSGGTSCCDPALEPGTNQRIRELSGRQLQPERRYTRVVEEMLVTARE